MVNNQAEKNSAVLHFAFRTADVGYLIREIAICLNIWQGQSRRCPTSTNKKANRTLNTIGFRPSLRPNPSSHPDVEFKMSDTLAIFRIRYPTSKQIEFGRLLQRNNRVPINSVHCHAMFIGHALVCQSLTNWDSCQAAKKRKTVP